MERPHNDPSPLTSKIELELELLQRHVQMLKTIIENGPIGIIRLSEITNFPQHKVRYSLRILEQEGLIEPSSEGAVVTQYLREYMTNLSKVLREMEKNIKDLQHELETTSRK